MRSQAFHYVLAAALFLSSPLFAQTETPPAASADTTAFQAITEVFAKIEQGGKDPTEADLKSSREAGLEMATKAQQFLKDYPKSEHVEDAQGFVDIGLFSAAVAGDDGAAKQLSARAVELAKDPQASSDLKLHAFAVNHISQWAKKNGKRALDQSSPEFQKAYMEAFFAAADVLANKDEIFKMILLEAKSGRELSAEEKRTLAQRVFDHPSASADMKAAAKGILSGEATYAVGKPLDIHFTALDGKKIDLADLKGKVVLIDFWATWCGPCVAEMPNVKAVYEKYHAQGFEIIGISLDEKKEALVNFLKKNDIPWPQYFDGKHWNNDISFRFGINAVPTEWLVDKKGILRFTEVRGNIEQAVDALLHEKE